MAPDSPRRLLPPEAVDEAVQALLAGQLVVFPTDTVYGIGGLAEDEEAVRRIYRVKRRPFSMALPVMLADASAVATVARETAGFAALARAFWPGPLTIILPRQPALPAIVTAGGDTVALRIPDHPLALQVLRSVARPLAVTSANLSGHPPACTAAEALAQLRDPGILFLDGGRAPEGRASTIVDLTTTPARILRRGPISAQAIAQVLGKPVETP
ncbi:MAG: threonylcarbamoyl-AMP synthase [Caldilineae bacterium]|nr:MAG: threonylcarbamoyl-AMP synthase [Caldilineae bacterium]